MTLRMFLSRRVVGSLVVLLLLIVFHAPILRGIAGVLVVDEPLDGPADAFVLDHDPETLSAAARLVREGRAQKILVAPFAPRRTDLLGITQPDPESTRRELIAGGVNESTVELISGSAVDSWDQIASLDEFLRRETTRKAIVVAPRFQGRAARRIVDATCAESERRRIGFASEPPLSFDEQSWWKVRFAVQRVFQGYLAWGYDAAVGRPESPPTEADFTKFDAAVARGEKP